MIKNKLSTLLLVLITSLIASTAHAWQLKPFEITYTATISGIPLEGQAQYSLVKNANNIWEFNTTAAIAIAERSETSTFKLVKDVIKPLSYEFNQVTFSKSKKITLSFDWDKNFAKGFVKDEEVFFSLKYKMLDQLSSQIALQQDVANGKKDMSYPVIDDDVIDTFKFNVVGDEVIDTPVGKLNTVKVERIREGKKSKRKTFLWFAKDWNYTVIRLYQLEKNGQEYVISLAQGTVNGKTIKGY